MLLIMMMMFSRRSHVACAMMALAAARRVKLVSSFVAAPFRAVAAPSMSRLHMSSNTQEVHVSIEYCSGCQWMLRSTWLASEILTTFASDASLSSISLIPMGPPLSEGGIFRITANNSNKQGADSKFLLWDRKIEGRFPESKEVKQLIRDLVDPDKDLGHSDKNKGDGDSSSKEADCIECKEQQQQDDLKRKPQVTTELKLPDIFYEQNKVSIEYSTGSVSSPDNGLYRANFYTNELLSCAYERNAWWKSYQQDNDDDKTASAPVIVDNVTLIPNRELSGVMKIQLNDEMVIYDQSKEAEDEYIDASRLRKIVTKAITHGDIDLNNGRPSIDIVDEDEAEEARKFFGVF
jgi:selenoprotein W-related protein